MDKNLDFLIQQALDLIYQYDYMVVLTGAGISTPSGIPDFRSKNTGLWELDDPMKVASLTTFRTKPEAFYNWLRPLIEKMNSAKPNPAHYALAELEKLGFIKAIATQNIDDLHQISGSKNVYQVHGSAGFMECVYCHKSRISTKEIINEVLNSKKIPLCPECRKPLKPAITLFEENLPHAIWQEAYDHFLRADLVLVVGSSLEVYPANQLPLLSISRDAKMIINTLSPTQFDNEADLLIPYNVVEVLPEIVNRIKNIQ